jgi:1-acyl-sn-glycerol-3-phosphate acyltransferase
MSLFPSKIISNVHPVAAADYWLSNRLIAWFAKNIVGIIPIERRSPAKTSGEKTSGNPMENISEALLQNKILIFFPEGSRGEAEQMTHFKSGIARISEKHLDVPITPIYLHGLGKCLPKGEGVLVPFICDVFVGNSLCWTGDRIGFVPSLEQTLNGLSKNAHRAGWE